jgi:hypothetical protein
MPRATATPKKKPVKKPSAQTASKSKRKPAVKASATKPSPKAKAGGSAPTLSFHSVVERQDYGFRWHYIAVPDAIVRQLPAGKPRLLGTLNGKPFRLSLLNFKDGTRYITLGTELRKKAGAHLGATVDVTVSLDPDPDRIDFPIEFLTCLEQDPEAKKLFAAYTPGAQRSVMIYIRGAKSSDVRIKRSLQFLHKMKTGQLYHQRKEKGL